MIVCATPRSGGTIFASDLAKQNNAKFINELMPKYILDLPNYLDNWKNKQHELGNQPLFTFNTFFENLHKATSEEIVILVNSTNAHWVFEKANYFIARKNQRHWLYSFTNLHIQLNTPVEILYVYIRAHVYQSMCMFEYCKRFDKKIDFYEESKYYRERTYRELMNSRDRDKLINYINSIIQSSNILKAYPGLHI